MGDERGKISHGPHTHKDEQRKKTIGHPRFINDAEESIGFCICDVGHRNVNEQSSKSNGDEKERFKFMQWLAIAKGDKCRS